MTVRVYTKPSCVQCVMTKRELTRKGIDYVEEDVTDPQTMAAVKELGFSSAPVVHAGGDDIWAGFQPPRIAALAARLEENA